MTCQPHNHNVIGPKFHVGAQGVAKRSLNLKYGTKVADGMSDATT